MFVFGLIMIACMCLLLLAGFLNEVMQDDWEESCARIIDKIDGFIDRVVER